MTDEETQAEYGRLITEATAEWHHDFDGLGDGAQNRHGSFTDSTAHTHCICWGAAWRTLVHLRSLPIDRQMALLGMERGDVTIGGRGDENHVGWEPSEHGDYWRDPTGG